MSTISSAYLISFSIGSYSIKSEWSCSSRMS
jgi:hypothetical protein